MSVPRNRNDDNIAGTRSVFVARPLDTGSDLMSDRLSTLSRPGPDHNGLTRSCKALRKPTALFPCTAQHAHNKLFDVWQFVWIRSSRVTRTRRSCSHEGEWCQKIFTFTS